MLGMMLEKVIVWGISSTAAFMPCGLPLSHFTTSVYPIQPHFHATLPVTHTPRSKHSNILIPSKTGRSEPILRLEPLPGLIQRREHGRTDHFLLRRCRRR